jgi:hypothetical protein
MAYLLAVNRTIRGKLPKDASPATWARFNDAFQTCELTPGEIAAEIRAGYAIAAIHDGRRKRDNWRMAQHIGIDLDDGSLSWDDIVNMPLVADHAAIIHTTASHRPDNPRYRVLFLLEDPIDTPDSYAYIVGCMLRAFATADPLCKDPSRLFFGAPDCSLLLQPDNRLTSEDLANIVTAWPAEVFFSDIKDQSSNDGSMVYSSNDGRVAPRTIGYKAPAPATIYNAKNGSAGDIIPPAELSPLRLERHTDVLLSKIRTAPDGMKWETLKTVATLFGGYVASGYLDGYSAERLLRAAIETRRASVASMPAAYQTITEALAYGATRPLYYTRGDDAPPRPGAMVDNRQDLRRALIHERINELEGLIATAPMDAPDFAAMVAEYDHLKGAAIYT